MIHQDRSPSTLLWVLILVAVLLATVLIYLIVSRMPPPRVDIAPTATVTTQAVRAAPTSRPPAQQNIQPQQPSISCTARTCSSFASCSEVQQFASTCPAYADRLDRDKDGVYCDELCQ